MISGILLAGHFHRVCASASACLRRSAELCAGGGGQWDKWKRAQVGGGAAERGRVAESQATDLYRSVIQLMCV